jgi:hypothetical protein
MNDDHRAANKRQHKNRSEGEKERRLDQKTPARFVTEIIATDVAKGSARIPLGPAKVTMT